MLILLLLPSSSSADPGQHSTVGLTFFIPCRINWSSFLDPLLVTQFLCHCCFFTYSLPIFLSLIRCCRLPVSDVATNERKSSSYNLLHWKLEVVPLRMACVHVECFGHYKKWCRCRCNCCIHCHATHAAADPSPSPRIRPLNCPAPQGSPRPRSTPPMRQIYERVI